MNFRKPLVIASLAIALLIGTTVTHAQAPATQQEPVTRLHDGTKYVTRDDGIYIQCITCAYVVQITEHNDTPKAVGFGGLVKSLKGKITGKPLQLPDVDLVLVPQGKISKGVNQRSKLLVGPALAFPYGLDQTRLTVRSPQIQLHIGDMIYLDSNGDVCVLR